MLQRVRAAAADKPGAQLYLVYEPDVHAGDPPAEAQLGWIQVARWTGVGSPSPGSYVDVTGGRQDHAGKGIIDIYGGVK